MFRTVYLLTCLCALSEETFFENKVITTIRHGIEKNLEYIDNNYEKMNVDCLFGVVLSTVTKYMLDYNIWERNIKYRYNQLDKFSRTPDLRILADIFLHQNFNNGPPSTDFCLQDIVNLTTVLDSNKCFINNYCWNKYYVYDKQASGYTLTHKLLLLQLAKARKCIINKHQYEVRIKQLCSLIFAEVFNGDYFDVIDDMFDLFLEEIILCGYEGYADFLKNKWLFYILKTQRPTGCFPAILKDNLKTRIKRNTNILEDGCADHTTGLGVAVLALHYNFIIKENIINLE
ncbi:hypothetical protein NQ314_012994 [Rhamnusium bicolor]|uniref:Uncharacterized protein n=1 Tax=Rhamnusium bicolor TaxID=1586634 RepID=A0AAV8X834_9CUCU|nr:hypothetical protein NQ314_012994 [Rhamnusium bicolor]